MNDPGHHASGVTRAKMDRRSPLLKLRRTTFAWLANCSSRSGCSRERRLAGCVDPLDPELVTARERARTLCSDLNAWGESEQAERRRILSALFGKRGDSVWMQPPFSCDYGTNIELSEGVFFNSSSSTYAECGSAAYADRAPVVPYSHQALVTDPDPREPERTSGSAFPYRLRPRTRFRAYRCLLNSGRSSDQPGGRCRRSSRGSSRFAARRSR